MAALAFRVLPCARVAVSAAKAATVAAPRMLHTAQRWNAGEFWRFPCAWLWLMFQWQRDATFLVYLRVPAAISRKRAHGNRMLAQNGPACREALLCYTRVDFHRRKAGHRR